MTVPKGQRAGKRRAHPGLVDVDRGVVADHRVVDVRDVLLDLEVRVGNLEAGVETRLCQPLVGL